MKKINWQLLRMSPLDDILLIFSKLQEHNRKNSLADIKIGWFGSTYGCNILGDVMHYE